MFKRITMFVVVCVALLHLVHPSPVRPEVRAHLEEKVMSSMSLKEIESMVEKDERVLHAPLKKLIILPKPTNPAGTYDPDQQAYIIQRKSKYPKKATTQRAGFGFLEKEFDDDFPKSYSPDFKFSDPFKFEDEGFPTLFNFGSGAQESSPAKSFFESIVQEMVSQDKFQRRTDPVVLEESSASAEEPEYKPRFDYDSYAKDTTETKLKGKKYWKDAPERKEEMVDENGCRMVVKKIMDPEDSKKSKTGKPKSVIITKECEYPNTSGPDGEIKHDLQIGSSRLNAQSYNSEKPVYERPEELEAKKRTGRDPLAPDYIDSMLDSHFRSFPSFISPISSFKGYQDRFKQRSPSGFKDIKDIKPTVNVESYEYTHPQSGFEDNRKSESQSGSSSNDSVKPFREHHYHYDSEKEEEPHSGRDSSSKNSAKPYEHHYHYDSEKDSREAVEKSSNPTKDSPSPFEHHYHYDRYDSDDEEPRKWKLESSMPKKALFPKRFESEYDQSQKSSKTAEPSDYVEEKETKKGKKETGAKDPKMVKKSFAYYRKDNPKEDPNDQQYAEEYAQGNYRSFSSDYDSDRDGPKKQ